MKRRSRLWLLLGGAIGLAAMAHSAEATGRGRVMHRHAVAASKRAQFVETLELSGFLRGNLHDHSSLSDGDSSPSTVLRWYDTHGYDFMALTDHNRLVDAKRYAKGLRPDFIIIPGEEVTMGAKHKPVHVNALCIKERIGGGHFKSGAEAVRWAVDRIRHQGGVALVNHPNFAFALRAEDIAGATGAQLLDIHNGHPLCHSDGDGDHPGAEAIWQELLDGGHMLAPAAVDDAHTFSKRPRRGIPKVRPGTGWVGVAASQRSASGICAALAAGRLYASDGPSIARISVAKDKLSVWIEDAGASVSFIGRGGEVLGHVEPEADGDLYVAHYTLRGGERFVRARVEASAGKAWTPAFAVR